ncbi:MAG: hypothetical protein AAF411_17655, partial [Myxococcota bacterium]
MISRLWYFVIAAIAGAAVAAAYVAQGTLDYRSAQSARESLRRDRAELELMLRTDARNRLDSLGPMAAHEEVRTALAAASNGRRGLDSAARTRLGNTLAQLNGQLQEGAAQLLFALDANGAIVAQLGGTTPPAGAGIGAFPVAERALRGYLTDDVLVYSDGQNPAIYRAAARPVVQGNRYVGAIVHCSEIGADLANRLSSRLGDVSLAFFFRGEITTVDADAPGVSRAELETGLAAALEAPELNERGHSEVVELPNDGVGVFVLAKGTARHAGAGYAIARTPAVLGSPMALFDAVPDAVMGSVNWLLVVAVPLVLALLGVLFFFLERDRPFSGFRKLAEAVGAGSAPHFDEAGVPARFRKIAHSINEALGRGGGGLAAPKTKADLDEILGQAGSSSSSPYFGFADGKEDAPKNDLFDAAPKPVLEPPPCGCRVIASAAEIILLEMPVLTGLNLIDDRTDQGGAFSGRMAAFAGPVACPKRGLRPLEELAIFKFG